MVLFNYSTRELTAKIVYYGPGLCGKTTNLQFIHENLPGEVKGKMLSLATKTDRTLFFDFLPIDLGEIRGMKTRVQLYTVPGQVFYNETRKLVLKGADGIVFVVDSQETMLGANVESFKNLEDNLKAHGMKLAEMPHVLQFNKRDLPKLSPIEDLNSSLNKYNAPFYESVATTGIGIQDTLKAIVKLVLLHLTKKYDPKSVPALAEKTASVVVPSAVAAAAQAPAPPARAAQPTAAARPAAAARAAAPARASASKPVRAPEPTLPDFGDDEINGLVDEVDEIAAPAPSRAPAPSIPLAAAESTAPAVEDDGIWLGDPGADEPGDFSDRASTYGSNVSLEDLLSTSQAEEPAALDPDPAPAAWRPSPVPGSPFEIDRGFDPEWEAEHEPEPAPIPLKREPIRPAAEVEPPPAPPARDLRPAPPRETGAEGPRREPEPVGDLVLTEVASNDDLFADPSLEVARLEEGEIRDILVPVVLGDGPTARRFKLSIRLRFEPLD